MPQPHISVVTPVYGCPESLDELYTRLAASLGELCEEWEIVMVNDASPDDSWQRIQRLAALDPRVRGVNLSRNFGQHYAITAGIDIARGDWVVVMDCDLQDRPEEIPKLYAKAQEGYQVVVGRRAQRRDSFLKRASSRLFGIAFRFFTRTKVDHSVGNFGIYGRDVIDGVCRMREQNRSFALFAHWVGFRRTAIDVEHSQRPRGSSSYTLRKLLRLAFDSIVSHSNRLLWLSVVLGFGLALVSLLGGLWLVIRYLTWGISVVGWTSLIVSVFFSTGLLICNIGVVGLYVGKIFDEVKRRPLYLVGETTFGRAGEPPPSRGSGTPGASRR